MDLNSEMQISKVPMDQDLLFGYQTGFVEVLLMKAEDYNTLLESVRLFAARVEILEPIPVSLFINGKVCVANETWWDKITPQESILISVLLRSSKCAVCRDIPVIMPSLRNSASSSSGPHRCLTFSLLQGAELCMICGPVSETVEPTLQSIEEERIKHEFRKHANLIQKYQRVDVPINLALNPGVLGYVLVHPPKSRITTCFYGNAKSIAERQRLLSSFYRDSQEIFVASTRDRERTPINQLYEQSEDYCLCAVNHHALKLQIFVLVQPNLPKDELLALSQETMEKLKKHFVI